MMEALSHGDDVFCPACGAEDAVFLFEDTAYKNSLVRRWRVIDCPSCGVVNDEIEG